MWDTTVASTDDASMTSEVAGATKDDDDDVVVIAEEDRVTMPTTDGDVVEWTWVHRMCTKYGTKKFRTM